MTDDILDPLFGAAPAEIPLPRAPLVNVLCQVRFPEIVSVRQKAFIADFQEQVRAAYPLLSVDKLKAVTVDEQGASVSVSDENIWRFTDASRSWRLSLAPSFFSLETRKYESRANFMEKLGNILNAVQATIRPTHVTRVGIRYVDRVVFEDHDGIEKLLRSEMLGLSRRPFRENMKHSISEMLCKVEEGQLMARWGMLPANGSHEPEIMPPTNKPSWFLDLDTFADHQLAPIDYDPPMILGLASGLATRAYSFFRWAVTDDFLQTFGGKTR